MPEPRQVVNSFKRSMDLGQGGAYIWDAVLEENGGSVEATGEYEVTSTFTIRFVLTLSATM